MFAVSRRAASRAVLSGLCAFNARTVDLKDRFLPRLPSNIGECPGVDQPARAMRTQAQINRLTGAGATLTSDPNAIRAIPDGSPAGVQ